MNKQCATKEYIDGVLKASRFAVLATESNGQPHTSLIAITPLENSRQVIFATYRDTIKYQNLAYNNKVAVLINGCKVDINGSKENIVLSIIGNTKEISIAENKAAYQEHLKCHPEMESFMRSSECAFFMITARLYQVVYGIDEISWVSAEELE